jgi:hypothetical protein
MKTYVIKTYFVTAVVNHVEAESVEEAYEQAQEYQSTLTHSELLGLCPNGLVWSDAEAFEVSESNEWTQIELDINA